MVRGACKKDAGVMLEGSQTGKPKAVGVSLEEMMELEQAAVCTCKGYQ